MTTIEEIEQRLNDELSLDSVVAWKRDIRFLLERVKELEHFSDSISKYVMPGVADTQDAALKLFKELKRDSDRLKAMDAEMNQEHK
jgi:seryl-tRNA synthetase